jgi:predicted methyltransferase
MCLELGRSVSAQASAARGVEQHAVVNARVESVDDFVFVGPFESLVNPNASLWVSVFDPALAAGQFGHLNASPV